MDIKQSKAIISGGASGLGFATAENIINKGGKVALLDINKDGEKSAKSLGNSVTYIQVDISAEDEVKAAIKEANNFLDGINLAVNCAGVIGAARALGRDGTMDANFFERTIKINLIGSFILAKESANIMQNNNPNNDGERGVIVNTACLLYTSPSPRDRG